MTSPTADDSPPVTTSYRTWVLLLLMLIYLSNFVDRIIISVLGEAIKLDLKITDGQMGLLAGLAFAGSYGLMCIPIARLAERFKRTTIIAVAITVWSAFTALCGMAHTFTHLLLFRIGVGGGVAGLARADADAEQEQVGEGVRHAAERGERRPDSDGDGDDGGAFEPLGQPGDRDAHQAVGTGERQACQQAHLSVGDLQVELYGLAEDADDDPVDEVAEVDEHEQQQHPRPVGRRDGRAVVGGRRCHLRVPGSSWRLGEPAGRSCCGGQVIE